MGDALPIIPSLPMALAPGLDPGNRGAFAPALLASEATYERKLTTTGMRKELISGWETLPARFPFHFVSLSSCQREAKII